MKTILATLLVLSGLTAQAQIKMPEMKMCTMALVPMHHPETKEFIMASNGCEAEALRQRGFVDGPYKEETPAEVIDENEAVQISKKLSLITKGNAQIVNFSCADGRVCRPTTTPRLANAQIQLSVATNGCLDSALITYKVQPETNTVIVTALNIANEESTRVRCFAPNVVSKVIDLGFSIKSIKDIKIEFVKNVAK